MPSRIDGVAAQEPCHDNIDARVDDKRSTEMKNSSRSKVGRKPLSSQERARFESYMAEIFGRLGMDLDSEPCKRTPHRWVQALVDMTDGYNGDPNIEVVFNRECVNCAPDVPTVQIVEGPIDFASLCEHHVLPFIGQAYIGCLRHEKIIGLSKFTRIVRKYARRFTVQERIAQEIANELERIIEPHGVIVHLRAHHSCTQCRGVREMGALTRTIERRGDYVSNYQLVAEFMSLAGLAR
jgi:GTP cyclohydrolase IA